MFCHDSQMIFLKFHKYEFHKVSQILLSQFYICFVRCNLNILHLKDVLRCNLNIFMSASIFI